MSSLSKINGGEMEMVWAPGTHIRIFGTFLVWTLSNFICIHRWEHRAANGWLPSLPFSATAPQLLKAERPSPAQHSYNSWTVHTLNSSALGRKHDRPVPSNLPLLSSPEQSTAPAQIRREQITLVRENFTATFLCYVNLETPRTWTQHVFPFP